MVLKGHREGNVSTKRQYIRGHKVQGQFIKLHCGQDRSLLGYFSQGYNSIKEYVYLAKCRGKEFHLEGIRGKKLKPGYVIMKDKLKEEE